MAKVSIVIPVYKVEKYIEECLDSVINQTFSDIEIILVDDKSPDSCPEICERYAKNDKRITVVHHEENKGTNGAVMTGINTATAEFIMFIDSDDYVSKNFVETYFNEIYQNKVDCVVFVSNGDCSAQQSKETQKKLYSKQDIETKILEKFFYETVSLNNIIGNPRWAKIYKTEIIKKAAKRCNPKLSMGEDVELNINFLSLCDSVLKISANTGYFYRTDNETSITNSYDERRINQDELYISEIKNMAKHQNRDGQKVVDAINNSAYPTLHDIFVVLNGELAWDDKLKTTNRMLKTILYMPSILSCSHEMYLYLSAQIENEQKLILVNNLLLKIENAILINEQQRNYYYVSFMFRVLESGIPAELKLRLAGEIKEKLSEKKYILNFAKEQPLMGKLACFLIYLRLEKILIKLLAVLKQL